MRNVVKRKKILSKFYRFLSKCLPVFVLITCAGMGCGLAYCASILSLALWAPSLLFYAGAVYEFVRIVEKNSRIDRFFRRKARKLYSEAKAIETAADSHVDRAEYRKRCHQTDIWHRENLINRLKERKSRKNHNHPDKFYDKKIADNNLMIEYDRTRIKELKQEIKGYIANQNAVYDNYKKTGKYELPPKKEEIADEEIEL